MFLDNLSQYLQRECKEQAISQERLAEDCDLSRGFVGRLIHHRCTLSVTSLEKICTGLRVTPNELLLGMMGALPRRVTAARCLLPTQKGTAYPVCPGCGADLERDYQRFCDRCGQKLDWSQFASGDIYFF